MSYMIHKYCRYCNQKKPLLLGFYTRCDTGGYKTICKECDKKKVIEWQNKRYKNDPDFRAASIKRMGIWSKNNKEKQHEHIKNSRRKARKEVNLSYAKEVITKHSPLRISDIPDSMARAKQVNIKLQREARNHEKY